MSKSWLQMLKKSSDVRHEINEQSHTKAGVTDNAVDWLRPIVSFGAFFFLFATITGGVLFANETASSANIFEYAATVAIGAFIVIFMAVAGILSVFQIETWSSLFSGPISSVHAGVFVLFIPNIMLAFAMARNPAKVFEKLADLGSRTWGLTAGFLILIVPFFDSHPAFALLDVWEPHGLLVFIYLLIATPLFILPVLAFFLLPSLVCFVAKLGFRSLFS